jgi:hypothetical protein
MKKLFFTFFIATWALIASSQDTDTLSNWKLGGMSTLTFTQVSLSKYWAAGGENSLSGGVMINFYANYEKDNVSWANSLDLGYGLIKQGDITKKSNDRIDFSSQYGKKASEKWNYSGLFNFKTQFAPGYNYPNDQDIISNFFAPAYITTSLGMEYKPDDRFSLFLSPVTGKFTFVADDSLSASGSFGVEPGEKFRAELGGFLKAMYKTPLFTNVDLQTKLDLFSNYLNNPQNIDVNMEILINMQINKFLSANINTLFIYDDDINFLIDPESGKKGPRLQFKEVIGLGLSYKF